MSGKPNDTAVRFREAISILIDLYRQQPEYSIAEEISVLSSVTVSSHLETGVLDDHQLLHIIQGLCTEGRKVKGKLGESNARSNIH